MLDSFCFYESVNFHPVFYHQSDQISSNIICVYLPGFQWTTRRPHSIGLLCFVNEYYPNVFSLEVFFIYFSLIQSPQVLFRPRILVFLFRFLILRFLFFRFRIKLLLCKVILISWLYCNVERNCFIVVEMLPLCYSKILFFRMLLCLPACVNRWLYSVKANLVLNLLTPLEFTFVQPDSFMLFRLNFARLNMLLAVTTFATGTEGSASRRATDATKLCPKQVTPIIRIGTSSCTTKLSLSLAI